MRDLENFKIDMKGLNEGLNVLNFNLDDDYFKAIEAPEVKSGNVRVSIEISRTSNFFDLNIHSEGIVRIPCDLCLDEMEQPIETTNRLTVKFGEEYSEEDDLVTIEENEGKFYVAWFIYEFIALNIPIKHVHAPGKCNPAMMRMLNEHSAARSSEGKEKAVDPRWSELEKLRTTIKD